MIAPTDKGPGLYPSTRPAFAELAQGGPGLYIHVPFCVRKCLYCDFYSLPTGHGALAKRLNTDAHDASLFLDALEAELKQLPADFRPATIFVGGGTPTELSTTDFTRLLSLIRGSVDISRIVEWSCESNPGTLTREKAELLRGAGVNRVSLGVQSFDTKALEFLGRIHSADEAIAGYRLLRDVGFDNINLDLIYGVPGVSRETVERDVETLASLAPDHTACYCLIFEDGTPLADLRRKGFVKEVDDDEELEQYRIVRERLAAAGYQQYEISNFAKPGRACRHNLLYWGPGEYIGCGPSAHSHWAGSRFGNVRNLDAYCEALLGGRSVRAFEERLDPEKKAREALVMGLRRIDGVVRADFKAATDFDYADLCRDEIAWMSDEGLLETSDERLRLTDRGLFVSDAIFAELV
jgi:oxygen-independent coproporphyrinogen-3 oxidase